VGLFDVLCLDANRGFFIVGFGRGKVSSFLYDICLVIAFGGLWASGLCSNLVRLLRCGIAGSRSERWDVNRMGCAILIVYRVVDGNSHM
jgi:hypothetical protein